MSKDFQCIDTHTIRWGFLKPTTTRQRRQLLKREGKKCFLMPEGTPYDPKKPHYPICSKDGCLACTGLEAAYKRMSIFRKSYQYRKMANRIDKLLKKSIKLALQYANPNDPTNQCNWAFRAATKYGISTNTPSQKKGGQFMAKLRVGQCRTTKKGIKYCNIPGVGVRFQKGKRGTTKRKSARRSGQLRGLTCDRFKTVTNKYGKRVKRCAKFSSSFGKTTKTRKTRKTRKPRQTKAFGRVYGKAQRGSRCIRWKYVVDQRGRRVKRCAKFA